MSLKELVDKYKPTKKELICAVPETIAATAFYLPINAGIETLVAGMDNETSLIARGIGILATYLTIPYIMRGRNLARKITHTTKESSGYKKFASDSAFALAFGVSTKAALYTVAGTASLIAYSTPFDYESLLTATGSVAIIATATSGASFYTIDVFKELTGYKEMRRTPQWLRNKTSNIKKQVVTGAIIASLAISGLIYSKNVEQEKSICENENTNQTEQYYNNKNEKNKIEYENKYNSLKEITK